VFPNTRFSSIKNRTEITLTFNVKLMKKVKKNTSTIHKSFRLDKSDITFIRNTAQKKGVSQTAVLKSAVDELRGLSAEDLAQALSKHKGKASVSDKEFEILRSLGIATASGIAGYHLSKYIRKQLDFDEDKGYQTIMGIVVGLTVLLATFPKQ